MHSTWKRETAPCKRILWIRWPQHNPTPPFLVQLGAGAGDSMDNHSQFDDKIGMVCLARGVDRQEAQAVDGKG